MSMENRVVIRSAIVYIKDDSFLRPSKECLIFEPDGMIVIDDGIITQSGPASEVLKTLPDKFDYTEYPDKIITEYPDKIIVPGFIGNFAHDVGGTFPDAWSH